SRDKAFGSPGPSRKGGSDGGGRGGKPSGSNPVHRQRGLHSIDLPPNQATDKEYFQFATEFTESTNGLFFPSVFSVTSVSSLFFQSPRSFSPIAASLSRTSFSDVMPKFLASSSSSAVRLHSSPTVEMFSLFMHLRARTERFRSITGLFMTACSSGVIAWWWCRGERGS